MGVILQQEKRVFISCWLRSMVNFRIENKLWLIWFSVFALVCSSSVCVDKNK